MEQAEQKKDLFSVSFTTRGGIQQAGPLALLWKLIENYDVDIFEVSLSRITGDFIDYIKKNKSTIEEESEFVLMASRLINYKSKLLLPNPGFEEENDPDSLPPELVEQLLEYKKFQIAAEQLREIEDASHLSFIRENTWKEYEEGIDYLHVDLVVFLKAFRDFLDKKEKEGVLEVEAEEIDIETMVAEIKYILAESESLIFFHWLKDASVMRVVVAFLAILELVRLRAIQIHQAGQYQEIKITPTDKLFLSSGEIINHDNDTMEDAENPESNEMKESGENERK